MKNQLIRTTAAIGAAVFMFYVGSTAKITVVRWVEGQERIR